jgi:hypothetical protein
MNVKWTEEAKQYIIDNARHMKDSELAKKLTEKCKRSITLDAVRLRQKLGIKKKHGRGICALVKDNE